MKKRKSPSFAGFTAASIFTLITIAIFILLVLDYQSFNRLKTISGAKTIALKLDKELNSSIELFDIIEAGGTGKSLAGNNTNRVMTDFVKKNSATIFSATRKNSILLHGHTSPPDEILIKKITGLEIEYNSSNRNITNLEYNNDDLLILSLKIGSGEIITGVSISRLMEKTDHSLDVAIRIKTGEKIKSVRGNHALFNTESTIASVRVPGGIIEIAAVPKNGWFGVSSLAILILLAGIAFSVSTGFFIAKTRSMTIKIHSMSFHDHLTGLPNRTFFTDRFSMAIARARRYEKKLAVIMIDLDKFKYVNNTYGYKIGDMLLQRIAQRLLKLMRETDSVVRSGGDEFIILLPDIESEKDLAVFVDKLSNAFKAPYLCGKLVLHTSFTMGSAIYPEDGDTIDALIKTADINMYKAKNDKS